MNSKFLIAFVVCLAGYVFHTMGHILEHKGHKSKILESVFLIAIAIGYLGWGFMISSDPIKLSISNCIATPLGLLIGLPGVVIFIMSAAAKKGFEGIDHLVTTGIYSKFRNPMYLGIILIHIGFPLAARSLLTLISAIIWISLILIWKYWEEQDLEKKFGSQYSDYRKRTWF
jgi:protein-S-isoprenylcysteine O-methyltransferase Ste14